MGKRIIARDTDGYEGDGIKCCELGCEICTSSGCNSPHDNSQKSNLPLFLIIPTGISIFLLIILICVYFIKRKKK